MIKKNSESKRKLLDATNDFMQIIFVVLMIYLMFNQPFLTGLMLFFGGLGSMFRRMLLRERKLKQISGGEFEKIASMKSSDLQKDFLKERSSLFHYLQKNPFPFSTLSEPRLAKSVKDYFAQEKNKNDPSIWKKIDKATKFVMKHSQMIDKWIKNFTPEV